jgi:putative nucleotidyltransferase with HDIG domain
MGEVYERKEPITICDVRRDKRFEEFAYPVTRVLVVPLMVEEEVIGAIVASDKLDGEEFFSTEIKLIMSIATECAVSIKKALLYDEIHDMLFSTAEALSLAMDAKDPYTYGHSKRVSQLSVSIAESFGLSAEDISKVRLAALLHDIGKLGTPEVILGKDTHLEPEEMDRMKEHPYMGARMLENIRRMKEIATWMCHHHEKYDGTGYPSGLKGDQIPLPSRIIALADYYDALTSDRPYRKALSRKEAINIMKESVGTHFDPVVYEHFIKVPS